MLVIGILKVNPWHLGGCLFQWQPIGLEGGGGRTASFTKLLSTSYKGWRYPLRHGGSRCWRNPLLDPLLGSRGWNLAGSWRSRWTERIPCCCCRSKISCGMPLIWREKKLIQGTFFIELVSARVTSVKSLSRQNISQWQTSGPIVRSPCVPRSRIKNIFRFLLILHCKKFYMHSHLVWLKTSNFSRNGSTV